MLLLAVPAGAVASEDVSFPDANLEAAVRDALRISEEGITVDDMATLSVLDADGRGISDLSGLEHAVNLRDLDLEDNEISDLGPLANLTKPPGTRPRG
jgi:Leucine-rich repeat (LRR) protein